MASGVGMPPHFPGHPLSHPPHHGVQAPHHINPSSLASLAAAGAAVVAGNRPTSTPSAPSNSYPGKFFSLVVFFGASSPSSSGSFVLLYTYLVSFFESKANLRFFFRHKNMDQFYVSFGHMVYRRTLQNGFLSSFVQCVQLSMAVTKVLTLFFWPFNLGQKKKSTLFDKF